MKVTSKIPATSWNFKKNRSPVLKFNMPITELHSIHQNILTYRHRHPCVHPSDSTSLEPTSEALHLLSLNLLVYIYPFISLFSTLPGLVAISWYFISLRADAPSSVWNVLHSSCLFPMEILFFCQSSANHYPRNAQINPVGINHFYPLHLHFFSVFHSGNY